MVSRTEAQLIDNKAILSFKEFLVPQAAIITPNRCEAEIVSGSTINNLAELEKAVITIHHQGNARIVLAKAGNLSGKERGKDIWCDSTEIKIISENIVSTINAYSTGCTFSAAVCASLALGKDIWPGVVAAKQYVTTALEYSLNIGNGNGNGNGSVGHFFPLLQRR